MKHIEHDNACQRTVILLLIKLYHTGFRSQISGDVVIATAQDLIRASLATDSM